MTIDLVQADDPLCREFADPRRDIYLIARKNLHCDSLRAVSHPTGVVGMNDETNEEESGVTATLSQFLVSEKVRLDRSYPCHGFLRPHRFLPVANGFEAVVPCARNPLH